MYSRDTSALAAASSRDEAQNAGGSFEVDYDAGRLEELEFPTLNNNGFTGRAEVAIVVFACRLEDGAEFVRAPEDEIAVIELTEGTLEFKNRPAGKRDACDLFVDSQADPSAIFPPGIEEVAAGIHSCTGLFAERFPVGDHGMPIAHSEDTPASTAFRMTVLNNRSHPRIEARIADALAASDASRRRRSARCRLTWLDTMLKPHKGDIAVCGAGCIGLITSDCPQPITYRNNNQMSLAWTGIHLTDKIGPVGAPWSSRKPRVLGHIEDVEALLLHFRMRECSKA